MAHKDNTLRPSKPGVYVNRFYSGGRDCSDCTNTVRVGDTLSELAELVLADPTDDIMRWWYETHNEQLIVVSPGPLDELQE